MTKAYFGLMPTIWDHFYRRAYDSIPLPSGWYNNSTTVVIFRAQSIIKVITEQEETASLNKSMVKVGAPVSVAATVIMFLFRATPLSFGGSLPRPHMFANA